MPHLITRAEAIERITAERSGDGCLLCELVRGEQPRWLLHQSAHCTALLTRYPRQWGHVMVVLNAHHTEFSEVTTAAWTEASALALRAAAALEAELRPARCYIATTGTDDPTLPMTFPHLHQHVIPVAESSVRPRDIFTWEHGVYAAQPAEWEALHAAISGRFHGG